jgi:hypothetical protein
MFPYRLYGALPRVVGTALFLLVILVMAFSAHADGRHHHRHHWHHHHARHHRVATLDTFTHALAYAKPIMHEQAPVGFTVFGREVGAASTGAGFVPDVQAGLAHATGVIVEAHGAVADLVRATAARIGVPERYALAIAHFESGYRMSMRGASGERGAMQVLPQTAWHVGVTGNLYGQAGIEAGVRYLKEALDMQGRYGPCAALSAYNHGLGYVSCSGYGRTILALASGAPTLGSALIEARWSVRTWRRHRHRHWRA